MSSDCVLTTTNGPDTKANSAALTVEQAMVAKSSNYEACLAKLNWLCTTGWSIYPGSIVCVRPDRP